MSAPDTTKLLQYERRTMEGSKILEHHFSHELIGRRFKFSCEHNSHYRVLVGTIAGMEFSDEANLRLFVSVPMMKDKPLVSINFDGRTWFGVLEVLEDHGMIAQRVQGVVELI